MATGFLGLPTALELSRDSLRRIATVVNGILAGKQNNVTTLTLTASSATTTFNDPRIGANSHLAFTPLTANAEQAIIGQGGLIGRQVISATGAGTYTPTTGTDFVVIELIGGGGGGGAVASPGGTNAYIATGGQAGGWLSKRLTSGFAGASYSVGAKGTGGAAGANNGNAGSDTTFTTTGSVTYTAKGGAGGTKNGAFAPPFLCGLPTPNITTDGDFAKSGELGPNAISLSTANTTGGGGANGPYGYGGGTITVSALNTSSAGAAAGGFGGGGGGAAATGTGTQRAGGDGSDGAIIIWEYSYGGVGGMYVSSRGKQTATIVHANNSQSDRQFSVEITG